MWRIVVIWWLEKKEIADSMHIAQFKTIHYDLWPKKTNERKKSSSKQVMEQQVFRLIESRSVGRKETCFKNLYQKLPALDMFRFYCQLVYGWILLSFFNN